ncbi:MAG: tetratricopeptide repeat protein [Chromatiales bacterium]
MPRVFLNYRREDSEGIAGRIFDRLCVHFGPENVFRDLDTIAPGAEFASVIGEEIAKCDALIAIIGNEWLEAKDPEGKRRLDSPRDFVRTEIAEALSRKKLVIPTLVERARMPGAKDLPTEIALLAERNAIEISPARFEYDTERLIKGIAGERQVAASSSWWRWIRGWQRYLHFSADSRPGSPASVSVGDGSVAGNVNTTAGPGGVAVTNIGANTTINIGITFKEHEEHLKRREQELREEFVKTSAANKERLALLEKELAAVTAKRQNPEASLADFKATLAEATQALAKFKGELPEDQLTQAQAALAKGDTATAEALFGEALEQNRAQAAASNEKAAEAAYQLGQLSYERVDDAKAHAYYQEAATLESDNPTYLNMAGRLAQEVGRYTEARPFLEKALAIREKALGPNHPDVALSLNNLADLDRAQGQYGKAEPLYQRALALWEKALGPEHPDVAISLNNLAALYYDQGEYRKAELLYQRSVAIVEKALGSTPLVALNLNNLAELYRTQGRYEKAEPLYQRALAIREQALGPEHPHVAPNLNNLALLYDAQGQYEKAEPLLQRSLAISEKALGPEHALVATSLNNLAELYRTQGRYDKAEPLYQRALAIREKAFGPQHRDAAQSLNNLALLYYTQGQYEKAEPLLQRSLAISEKALDPDHSDVATSLNNLAGLYNNQGQYGKAEPLYQRALAIREKAFGPEHPDVAQSLNNLAELYYTQSQYGKAAPLYQRSLAVLEKALGPEHPNVATSLNNLALLYHAQGQYGKAEPLYERALQVFQKTLPPDHPDLAQFMENYSVLFAKLNRDREAKKWQAKADAARRQHAEKNRSTP